MGIIDNFLIKFTKNGNARGVKLALSLYNIKNTFEKFFSQVNPFRDKNVSGDQTLTKALEYAVTNLDHNIMKLLISAGADVDKIEKSSIGNVIRQHTIASEAMLYGDEDSLKNRKEKCCLVLGELIINGVIPQDVKDRSKILEIFKQTEGFDELKEVIKLKFKPQKPPRVSKCNDALLSKEPIYAEVYDAKISNSLEELSVSDYAEVYDSQKGSTENLSLEDSGYSSISDYENIDNFSEQKRSANLNNKEQSEPIYSKVDLFKKRAERKIKDIKANSGTYHGLVQDKVKKWQEQMGQNSDECVNLQQTNNQTIQIKTGFSVKEIRQKFECRDSGHDFGYDADTEVEQQLKLAPKSEIGSVKIENGVIGGCRYKITDISL